MPINILTAEKMVADALGADFTVVKLSGTWMVYPKGGSATVRGESRKLDLAIARCKATMPQ